MNRWLSILAVLLILLVTGGWLMWYFAYGVDDSPPEQAILAGLSGPVEIGWNEEGFVTIDAQSAEDAFAGLGYAHGVQRAWTLLLLRQTALGRQAEWFGDSLLTLDRFARRLEFAALAERAYDELTDEDRDLLEAYTRGLNAALQSRAVRLSEDIALQDVEPEPWAPAHTLAVERLFGWLATPPPPADSLAAAGADVQAFFRTDALLRDWLHLHGFEHSAAWAIRDSTGTTLYQRQVFGNTALPFYVEASVQWPDALLMGASIPGLPYFIAGKTQDVAWAIVPRGIARVVFSAGDTTDAKRYDRVISMDGTEELLTLRRVGETMYFEPPPRKAPPVRRDTLTRVDTVAAGLPTSVDSAGFAVARLDTLPQIPDSTWTLQWAGFQPVSDWAAWRALTMGSPDDFRLLDAAGLVVSQGGDWTIIGSPETVATFRNGVVVGNTPWAAYLAQDLDSLAANGESLRPEILGLNYRSAWAERLAPAMVASVDSIPNRSPIVEEALTYLRNWNYEYDPASIGASIFDTWVSLYRDSTGTLPQVQVPDTVYFENLLRYQTLAMAVAQLRAELGGNLSQWRWENVYPDVRYFPVWSSDSLLTERTGIFANRRYQPITLPGSGHPSALAWGSSPVQDDRFHPSVWEAWTNTSDWDEFYVRRRLLDLTGFLSRYRISDRPPAAVRLTPTAEAEHVTVLTPAPS